MEKNEYSSNDKERFISFLSDYGFKATFANEKDTLFLRKALQAMIKSEFAIEQVFFDKSDFIGTTLDSRGGIFDVACIDERGNHFLVEMQLSYYEFFMNRMKFYAFQKMNSMVHKGDYQFDNLRRIYSIGILNKSIFEDNNNYHNIGVIRNEDGYVMDNQITYITIELEKFMLKAHEVKTDLEKLIFTMKHFVTYNQERFEFPDFWTEEWIRKAITELDRRNFTIDENEQFERFLAKKGEEAYHAKKLKQEIAAAEQQVAVAEQQVAVAKQQATAAKQQATAAEQQAAVAKQQATAAEQQAAAAEQQAAAAKQQAAVAKQQAAAGEQLVEQERMKRIATEKENKERLENIIKVGLENNLSLELVASMANTSIDYVEQFVKNNKNGRY